MARIKARTLIEETEQYRRTHKCYPQTMPDFGLNASYGDGSFQWYGVTFQYAQISEGEFELELRFGSHSHISVQIESITELQKDYVLKEEQIAGGNVIFAREYYYNKRIAGKGYAIFSKMGKLKKVGTWTLFTIDGRSFLDTYGNGQTKGSIVEELHVDFNL